MRRPRSYSTGGTRALSVKVSVPRDGHGRRSDQSTVHGAGGPAIQQPSHTGECIPVQKEGGNEVTDWSGTSVTHLIAYIYDILAVDTSMVSASFSHFRMRLW